MVPPISLLRFRSLGIAGGGRGQGGRGQEESRDLGEPLSLSARELASPLFRLWLADAPELTAARGWQSHVLFLQYPWVNCTGIRTLNPGFRGSPLTHGYKTDPIMIHKRVTGGGHVLFLHIIIGSVLYPWVNGGRERKRGERAESGAGTGRRLPPRMARAVHRRVKVNP